MRGSYSCNLVFKTALFRLLALAFSPSNQAFLVRNPSILNRVKLAHRFATHCSPFRPSHCPYFAERRGRIQSIPLFQCATTDKQDKRDDENKLREKIIPPRTLSKIIRLRGPVDKGWQRGGKKLGIPTANLPESLFSGALSDVQTGVYCGWAVIEAGTGGEEERKGRNCAHRAVVNVGYSPTFEGEENREKIVEAHLMVEEGDIDGDFYEETMRLSLLGFLRPEKKFPSFPDLLAAINNDIECAQKALSVPPFADFQNDTFIVDACDGDRNWVGANGGSSAASWEFEEAASALDNIMTQ